MSNERILLVEDDPNLGDILKEYLGVKGYEVTLCRDGEEGWATYKKDYFQLCILDVMMPKMDGFTLGKEIRKVEENIPIIYLTAKNLKEDVIQGFRIGAIFVPTNPDPVGPR
jgi:DNA-binding response OmpR family regulator